MTPQALTARAYVAAGAAVGVSLVTGLLASRGLEALTVSALVALAATLVMTARIFHAQAVRLRTAERRVERVSELQLATIESLALAIGAKDQTAYIHIRRVQTFAAGLARACGFDDHGVQAIRMAALLRDIGKLAVPEHILSKPGPLTAEEFQKVRIHPQVGADIIAGVPFPYPVAPLILAHHERWDGRGYPKGLRGEEIPLGARILSVVDYFDALICDRPYHRAMSHDVALQIVRQESGKALDPALVTKFVDLFDALEADVRSAVEEARKVTGLQDEDATARPSDVAAADSSKVFEDIARAQREIYGLYELAQAMGTGLSVADTMALIASKLSSLVPFGCCALFLLDEETQMLRCRFATGVDADAIRQVIVKNGHGLTGWVARNRRPLLNARPAADLEAAGLGGLVTSLQAALVSPLIYNERLIGTLSLYHVVPGCYTEDHRRLLDRISDQAAATIHNSIVFEQTQEDSLTDALTRLPNRRFMFMHLTSELARAERLSEELAVLIMDLDELKQINDTYGHHVGDRALRDVAQIIRSAIRPYDICVRYAGDEFVVVLSGCDADEAEQKRRNLQAAVESCSFEIEAGRTVSPGVSAGAAVYPADGTTCDALLMVADQRMYHDKARRKETPDRPRPAGDEANARPIVASSDLQDTPRIIVKAGDLRGGVVRMV